MPRAIRGVLVQCDASIKSIIVSIDNERNNEFVIEVLDDQNIVVKETMVQRLKELLEDRLKNTTQREEVDDSD
ncbi:TFIIH subunit TTDA/Tfb5 [Coniella lustricola]|uniref:General transcription and DNA repair factor IIH subunit TFB5 n=1 Tax=Coniella lustricola TaxID=2025994 RepID=A0A2T3A9Q2_9PEZI|nr:TFIIH subunit TTDA/Tfb5 [Coniella lustricola]